MNLEATKTLLGLLRTGRNHLGEIQVVRLAWITRLFPRVQGETLAAWAHTQGNAGITTRSHSGKTPPIPYGTRMHLDEGWPEFIRVSRDGVGYMPLSPHHVRYRRWYYVDGTPRQDGYMDLQPAEDDLTSAWDRLLPGWQWTTVPLPAPPLPPPDDGIWGGAAAPPPGSSSRP